MQFTRHFHSSPTFLCAIAATVFTFATNVHAEDKSLWQKFKDFFSPTPVVDGDGPDYDELRDLDKQINTLEGKYVRERRPNNKARIKKDLDKLKAKRETLAKNIETKEKNPPPSQATATSSSTPEIPQKELPICGHDTIMIHDTVTIHDTLYVIVANKPSNDPAPSDSVKEPDNK